MSRTALRPGVLAVDAGNSKTDLALVGADGSVLATARGGGFQPQVTGPAAAVAALAPLVADLARQVGADLRPDGPPLTDHVSACLLSPMIGAHFGLAGANAVAEAIHLGRIDRTRLHEVTRVLFAAAEAGAASPPTPPSPNPASSSPRPSSAPPCSAWTTWAPPPRRTAACARRTRRPAR